jgi:Domain of unknown function (DUF4389)
MEPGPEPEPLREPWHPVRVRVDDDLRRSRLTVLFRLVLAVPHLLWLTLWWYAMFPLVVFLWLATLFAGRLERDTHSFVGRWVRYHVHLTAYVYLLANPYPRFFGRPHEYPIDLDLAEPERQSRWTIAFRLVLALPALIFAGVLGTIAFVVGLLGWFASLALARMPLGLRDLGAYCVRCQAQAYAYLPLLTPRYPTLAGGPTGVEPPTTTW